MIRPLTLLTIALVAITVHANPLAEYRWKNRLLLWQSDSADFTRQFQKTWNAVTGECAERDLLVLPVDSADLRTQLDVGPGSTIVLLVGKDGGVKERWDDQVDPQTVFALIDAMPMRRSEMRE